SHLDNANVLRRYHDPAFPIFAKYYVINGSVNPTWLSSLVLWGLMTLFPPETAERILLSSYIVLLPVSIWWAMTSIRGSQPGLAFLGFPFIYNFAFHFGFYNYFFSLAVYFLFFGFWIRHNSNWTAGRAVLLGILSILLYGCHLISFAMALLG